MLLAFRDDQPPLPIFRVMWMLYRHPLRGDRHRGPVPVVAGCIAWMVTLYEGGRFASDGNRLLGIWCVVSNPLFWILGLFAALKAY